MITIATENPISLSLVRDEYKNFDNINSQDRLYTNQLLYQRFQKYLSYESVKLVVVGSPADTFTLKIGTLRTSIIPTTETIGGFKYFVFDIDFSVTNNEFTRLYGSDGSNDYISEFIQLIPNKGNLYKVEYFNEVNTKFVNYNSGSIVFHRWLNVKFLPNIKYEGEATVFNNLGKLEKTNQTRQRVFNLQIPEIHLNECESITSALGLTNFYINEIEYVNNGNPEAEQIGNTNLYTFEGELTQASIKGYNSSN